MGHCSGRLAEFERDPLCERVRSGQIEALSTAAGAGRDARRGAQPRIQGKKARTSATEEFRLRDSNPREKALTIEAAETQNPG
jgi:hypothetical protein